MAFPAVAITYLSAFAIIMAVVTPVMLTCVCIGCCSYMRRRRGELNAPVVITHKGKLELYPSYKPERSPPPYSSVQPAQPPAPSELLTTPPPAYGDVA